jgi:hypothetical protein
MTTRVQLKKMLVVGLKGLGAKKLVAEVSDSSGTQRKGNIRRWKPLPSNS